MTTLKETPLTNWHRDRGAKLVPFAGWSMPVQYPTGTLKEHLACRSAAALFDVSHMCQLRLPGAEAAAALEEVVPGDLKGLRPGRTRYSVLLNQDGGVVDDLMVTALDDGLFVVVNASRADVDLAFLRDHLPSAHAPEPFPGRALLAVQGPDAAAAVATLVPEAMDMRFLDSRTVALHGTEARISRLGYTGEDGFELSLDQGIAASVADQLVAAGVVPAGLGARDSLRLEAGLCLYGHELDETTSPVEAGLNWVIGKRRWAALDFAGSGRLRAEREEGPARQLVGLALEGRAAARDGADVVHDGAPVGRVTSGGFAPSLGHAVALAYVTPASAALDTAVDVLVRGKALPARVVAIPFITQRYQR